jgi:hypothetical protein
MSDRVYSVLAKFCYSWETYEDGLTFTDAHVLALENSKENRDTLYTVSGDELESPPDNLYYGGVKYTPAPSESVAPKPADQPALKVSTDFYDSARRPDETFADYVARLGTVTGSDQS